MPLCSPRAAAPAAGSLLLLACASLPPGQYGVEAIRFDGVEQLAPEPIERCMLTVERDRFGIPLGLAPNQCNLPPFDRSAPRLALFAWPWTEWPALNHAVLELDRQRIERFYRARGFYDARVVAIRFDPPEAGDPGTTGADCDPDRARCTVAITIAIDEGAPLRVGEVAIDGVARLPVAARAALERAELPAPGARFDEVDYERGKAELAEHLAEASYAAAEVGGEVQLDHGRKLAHIRYHLTPGPAYRFGEVRVEGARGLDAAPIRAAAGLATGTPYRQSVLTEAQQEVYALGAFSAVEVERELEPATRLAHLRVRVTPLPDHAFRVGAGITSGALRRTDSGEVTSVRQWDVHLFARYERRHVFGTLGKLRIEERPRLIFQRPFPRTTQPELGNVVLMRLNQPGLIEARTDLVFTAQWDYGPDPYLGFARSDLMLRIAAKRAFARRRLAATLALQQDLFAVASGQIVPGVSEIPASYTYRFLEQELALDLRDAPVWPRAGVYAALLVSQSIELPGSDFSAVRVLPEVRAYLPLPFQAVLAGRFAVAAMFILSASPELDATSRALGPNPYRLRGGGAQSNRGFVAGELGAGREGGIRRWEGSLELRLRFGERFGLVGFFDVGDVIARPRLYLTEPNPSAGFGLRYLTPLGAIRFDAGFQLDPKPEADDAPWFAVPGALHLTLGEAF